MELTPEQRPASKRPVDTQVTPAPERLWSTAELAEYLGVPVKTIHQWRYMQKGPRASALVATCGSVPPMSAHGRTSNSKRPPRQIPSPQGSGR